MIFGLLTTNSKRRFQFYVTIISGNPKKDISSDYTIDGDTFFKHIKMLSDSGYSAILPDELYEFMLKGEPLPPKSLMITSMRFNLDHQVKSWFKAGIAANALKSSRENITHFSSKILTA